MICDYNHSALNIYKFKLILVKALKFHNNKNTLKMTPLPKETSPDTVK